MSLRNFLAENKHVGLIASAVILVVAGLMVLKNLQTNLPYGPSKWMYDLNTQKLIEGPVSEIAPVTLDGATFDFGKMGQGGAVVDAMVYSCGEPTAIEAGMSPDDLSAVNARLAYIARYDSASAEALKNPTEENSQRAPRRFVSVPDGSEWFPENSNPGMRLQEETVKNCPDGSVPVLTRP